MRPREYQLFRQKNNNDDKDGVSHNINNQHPKQLTKAAMITTAIMMMITKQQH